MVETAIYIVYSKSRISCTESPCSNSSICTVITVTVGTAIYIFYLQAMMIVIIINFSYIAPFPKAQKRFTEFIRKIMN